MNTYHELSQYYDEVFPLDVAQLHFILDKCQNDRFRSLDIGCGTGNLCVGLQAYFQEVYGMEPDHHMLLLAQQKSSACHWVKGGLLDLNNHISGKFDLISCMGNTLPHLSSQDEILVALKSMYHFLSPNGVLVLQLLNLEKMAKENIESLPLIKKEGLVITRRYQYLTKDRLQFHLNLKKDSLELNMQTPLLILGKTFIEEALKKIGFTTIEIRHSFKDPHYDERQNGLIVTARPSKVC